MSLKVVNQFAAGAALSASEWRERVKLQTGSDGPVRLQNYVGGCFVDASDGSTVDDIGPATGGVIATIPRSKAADMEAAAEAAAAAFDSWSATSAHVRADILDRIADGLQAWLPELALMESEDSGKTIKMATNVDIPRSIANFRFFAGQIRHDETGCYPMHDAFNYTLRCPIGVAGLISPWNLPLYLASWKIAPALACGNTVILKPSEITPRTASALAQIVHAAGVPAGVFNLVHGLGAEAGQALVAHPRVLLISFTGGTVTGRAVAATCAPMFKKLSLELGGKNATVIFGDANLDTVVPGALLRGVLVRGPSFNVGQTHQGRHSHPLPAAGGVQRRALSFA
jgi:aminomuconate-semialdehyde/2-hydroxymuconate-6-semialdehyde dehydrogenase